MWTRLSSIRVWFSFFTLCFSASFEPQIYAQKFCSLRFLSCSLPGWKTFWDSEVRSASVRIKVWELHINRGICWTIIVDQSAYAFFNLSRRSISYEVLTWFKTPRQLLHVKSSLQERVKARSSPMKPLQQPLTVTHAHFFPIEPSYLSECSTCETCPFVWWDEDLEAQRGAPLAQKEPHMLSEEPLITCLTVVPE